MTNKSHKIYISVFFITAIVITFYLAVTGFSYYTASIDNRFWNPNHNLLKPSGFLGHGLGITGSLMMIFGVAVYMARKRFRFLFHFGILKYWLEFHIFLCTLGPILVLFHTAFKFSGIVSVSFWSMVAVALSGVIGRFIYIQIPRSIQGQELSIKEIDDLNNNLTFKLREELKVDEELLIKIEDITYTNKYKNVSSFKALLIVFSEYFTTRKLVQNFKKSIKKKLHKREVAEIVGIIKSKITLARRIGLLRSMQSLFKYWHVIHLPVALVMFIIMLVHIIVAFTFGYRWIF
jgi:hypothetical protein